MRILSLAVALQLFLCAASANAQSIRDAVPDVLSIFPRADPSYRASDQESGADQDSDASHHIKQIQEFLVWEGLYPGPLDGEFGNKTVLAIKRFQKSINVSQDGKVNQTQFDLLRDRATKRSQAVLFTTVLDQPTGVGIGLPMAFLPLKVQTPLGPNFTARDGEKVIVALRSYRTKSTLASSFEKVRESFVGAKIDYAAVRNDWFVLSGEMSAVKFYVRFHQSMDRLAGFFVIYKADFPDFAVPLSMMSMSLQPFTRAARATAVYAEENLLEASLLARAQTRLKDEVPERANAPVAVFWRYKENVLRLVPEGNSRVFVYEKPGDEELKQGVRQGSILFKGARAGSSYTGSAIAYQSGCSAIGYAVEGAVGASDEEVELKGKMPTRDSACRITGFVEASMRLLFIKPSPEAGAQAQDASANSLGPIVQEIGVWKQESDSASSKILLDSLEELLMKSHPNGARYFKYVVDKTNLTGFREDMPVLRIVFPEQVFFDTDKASMRADAASLVSNLAGTIKGRANTGPVAIFVAGHTDARGKDAYNLDLSYRRADSVARSLLSQDLGKASLWRVGFGKAVPVRPNDGPKNWALNRRVEFLLASQPTVIAAWIKSTQSLCEDTKVDCGGLVATATFKVDPVGRSELASISVDVPARPSLTSDSPIAKERPALPFSIPERPSLFNQSVSE